MSKPLLINGWVCRLVRGQRSAVNYDTEEGAWLMPDGRLLAKNESGESTETNVPPTVLEWLVRPLLAQAAGICPHTLNTLGHCTKCGARPNDRIDRSQQS